MFLMWVFNLKVSKFIIWENAADVCMRIKYQ